MQNGIGSRLRLAGVVTVLMLGSQASALAAPAASAVTREAVDGVSLSEWTVRWWRWANAQWVVPYLDPDGRLCELGQDGPVWYLAGTNGRFQPRRQCVVPEGRHLLLPIINMTSYQTAEDVSCQQLQAGVAINNDHLLSAVVLLDGQPMGDMRLHRVKSEGCFRMDPDDEDSPLVAADGYWLMLKPLAPGRHTVSVGANYGAPEGGAYSQMLQTFEYVLHVGGRTHITLVGPPGMMGASAP